MTQPAPVESDDIERFLDIDQVAQAVGVARRTILYWVEQGNFPRPVKIGAATRWRVAEYNAWARQQRSRPKRRQH